MFIVYPSSSGDVGTANSLGYYTVYCITCQDTVHLKDGAGKFGALVESWENSLSMTFPKWECWPLAVQKHCCSVAFIQVMGNMDGSHALHVLKTMGSTRLAILTSLVPLQVQTLTDSEKGVGLVVRGWPWPPNGVIQNEGHNGTMGRIIFLDHHGMAFS
jgi:hypothetical protein